LAHSLTSGGLSGSDRTLRGHFHVVGALPGLPGAIGSQFCSREEPRHLVDQQTGRVTDVLLPPDLGSRMGGELSDFLEGAVRVVPPAAFDDLENSVVVDREVLCDGALYLY
jgi:hypothetical protein